MSQRKIIHMDMDAFYASVEQRDNPALRGKPVIVGGKPQGRGVVATCSYEARKFGVRSAMPCAQAYRLCPQGIFVKPNFKAYKEASEKIHEIFHEVTDLVEPLSLDEAYLDVTENKLGEPSARNLAVTIKHRIKMVTGLTASAGVSPLKFVSKVASDLRKPNGLVVVPPSQVDAFIQDLAVEKIWSVGPATKERLHGLGIFRARDLRRYTRREMVRLMGKHGGFIHDLAHGVDNRTVGGERGARKSRGAERTFHEDMVQLDEMEDVVRKLSERVWKEPNTARTVTLKVRYSDFETITRRTTETAPLESVDQVANLAQGLLRDGTEAGIRNVRLLGVSLSGFDALGSREEPKQLELPLYHREWGNLLSPK